MLNNEFDTDIKYRLYRTVREILHPTISKRNISNYKIIIDEELLPIRIYYPKKITNLSRVLIYIHGDGKVTDCNGEYSEICKNFSSKTNSLTIAIEYEEKKHNYKQMCIDIYNTVKYLYKELERNDIKTKNIVLCGDSTGCNIITGINYLNKKDIKIEKEILFYPTISLEYFGKTKYPSIDKNKNFNDNIVEKLQKYFTFVSYKKDMTNELINPLKNKKLTAPKTLIFVGNVDIVKDEACDYYNRIGNDNNKYIELPFLSHGFLKKIDKESEEELFQNINEFLI